MPNKHAIGVLKMIAAKKQSQPLSKIIQEAPQSIDFYTDGKFYLKLKINKKLKFNRQ